MFTFLQRGLPKSLLEGASLALPLITANAWVAGK